MTVKELLETLKDLPEDTAVLIEVSSDIRDAGQIEILHIVTPDDDTEEVWSVTIS